MLVGCGRSLARCAARGLALLLAIGLAVPALAETLEQTGNPGIDGAPGTAGDPGGTGGQGTAGQNVFLTADAIAQQNRATATGGEGGRGGTGGTGVGPTANGGMGGNGGRGGTAGATATVFGASLAEATATGGEGGARGFRGPRTGNGEPGPYGNGGDGGDASADASVILNSASFGLAEANATGGDSGEEDMPSLAGGNADALASSVNSGGGTARARATALGGNMERLGAPFFDRDPFPAATIGDATADAFARNTGSTEVEATAVAAGGMSTAGSTWATAEGVSEGGGDVTVSAETFGLAPTGTALEVHDAVSGSTSGVLTLHQGAVVSGFRSTPRAERGGEVVTSLEAINPGGGDLVVTLDALSGRGDPGLDGGDVVLGNVSAVSTTGANVSVDVDVRAGKGGSPDAMGVLGVGGQIVQEDRSGASPVASLIRGESNGGDVDVTVLFLQGGGGDGTAASGGAVGDGHDITMNNVATGDTTGSLSLSQTALGSSGGLRTDRLDDPPDLSASSGGQGGEAISNLTKTTTSSSLVLESRAFGGFTTRDGGVSANGISTVAGTNDGGSVRVVGTAGGGGGTRVFVVPIAGGDGISTATGTTTGNGHAVEVDSTATGGAGGRLQGSAPAPATADAGDAFSEARGTALGDASVSVIDTATGGTTRGTIDPAAAMGGPGGHGGDAFSEAYATGGGVSLVQATSVATGGGGAYGFPSAGDGGDADAFASATGLGAVEADAQATSGSSYEGFFAPGANIGSVGSAIARATANGTSGHARAGAWAGQGLRDELGGSIQVSVGSQADAAARATEQQALDLAGLGTGLEGALVVGSQPVAADIANARSGNTRLDEQLSINTSAVVLGVGEWAVTGRDDGSAAIESVAEMDVQLHTSRTGLSVLFAAYDFTSTGSDPTELSFSILRDGVEVGSEEQFASYTDLLAFLQNKTFDLGADLGDHPLLSVRLRATVEDDSSFSMGFAFTLVPEPNTGLLLGVGLLVLGRRRRSPGSRR